jgi:hypothetical protein
MMVVMTTWFVAACLGLAPADEPSKLARDAVVESFTPPPPVKPVPMIAFEIREITVASPDWRGKMLAQLEPIARQEGAAVWALDRGALDALLARCREDARCNVAQSPRMVAKVGEPARMTNETSVKYVAHLKRASDGAPNEGTHIAFIPELGEVHDGVRVNVASSRLQGQVLFAKVAIEQNQVLSILTTTYKETIRPKGAEKQDGDPDVVKTSLLGRIRPEPSESYAINGTIQVPEVVSRRIEGEWMIPSEGALLVSMGPITRREKGLLRQAYQERLIAITAQPTSAPPAAAPVAQAQAQAAAAP